MPRLLSPPALVLIALPLCLLGPASAEASFPACSAYPLSTNSNSTSLTTSLVTSTDFTSPRAFIGAGNQLKAFDPAAGAWLWTVTLSGTVRCDPVPVKLKDGTEVVLVTVSGCHLSCVRASDGFVLWNADLRMVVADPGDEIGGAPAVQLWAASDAAFQSSVPNDLVFAATRYVSTSRNRVYALNATNGTVRWTFNLAGTSSMNAASAGPTVDLAHDAVYVGTEQASPIQNSLWAFKSVSGLRAWTGFGTPAGRITQRPLLAGKRLYTTGLDNTLRATDCDSLPGSLIWSLAVASGPVADPVLDPDALSPLIAIACGGNLLRSVIDGGSFGSEIPSVSAIASAPVYLPGAGVFYAIDPTGHVQEFDSAVHIPLGPPASLCGDPALHLSLSHQPLLPSPWRLSVVGSARVLGYLTQVCVPWGYGAAPQSCGSNVAVEEPASAPATDELLPPFPNPTRSATRCAFTTSRACRAALFISDVQGRRVCRLAESEPAAGHRSLEWNGRDDAGRRVAAGIYSVRLALDGTPTRSARMVLVLR